jgi:A/G-specific adenine glycosylase
VPERFPQPGAKPQFEAVREVAVVAWRSGKVFVRRCQRGERWAGLWDFLRFPLTAVDGGDVARELARKVRDQAGLTIGKPVQITTLKHGVTRFRITLDCYRAACRGAKSSLPPGEWQWIEPAGLGHLPLSVTGRKLSLLVVRESRPGMAAAP